MDDYMDRQLRRIMDMERVAGARRSPNARPSQDVKKPTASTKVRPRGRGVKVTRTIRW